MTDADARKIAALVATAVVAYLAAPHIERGVAQARVAIGSRIRKGAWSLHGVSKDGTA